MNANYTEETCTGTGAVITTTGATPGNLAFIKSFADGAKVRYAIEDSAGVLKVSGIGIYSAGTITRNDTWNYDGVAANDNPASNIALSGGTHVVRCSLQAADADRLDNINTGALGITPDTVAVDTVLTANSSGFQVVASGTVGDVTITLPDATTIANSALLYLFENNGDGDLYVKNGAGSVIVRVSTGKSIGVSLKDNSTSAGVWSSFGFNSGAAEGPAGITVRAANVFDAGSTRYHKIVRLTDDKALAVYQISNTLMACVLTESGGVVTAGTPLTTTFTNIYSMSAVAVDSARVVATFSDNNNGGNNTAVLFDVAGSVVTVNSGVQINAGYSSYSKTTRLSASKLFHVFGDDSNGSVYSACVLTVAGSVVTAAAVSAIGTAYAGISDTPIDVESLTETQVIVAYNIGASSSVGEMVIINITGDAFTVATPVTFGGTLTGSIGLARIADNQCAFTFRDNVLGGAVAVVTVAANVPTLGAIVNFGEDDIVNVALDLFTSTKGLLAYQLPTVSGNHGVVNVVNIAGSTVTLDAQVAYKAVDTDDNDMVALSINKAIAVYQDDTNVSAGTASALELESWQAF